MHRRNILGAAFAASGVLFAAGTRARADTRDAGKVVYHLADLDKVAFVLGNIENHLAGVGGPEKVTIELVVHGPALRAFHASAASHDTAHRLASLIKAQVTPAACGHTMRGQNVTLKDLLPGFSVAERGGVVRLAELQAQGYVYLRP
ncbi:MAG TPA: DsrE family protein [Xanthobacteraceae bacterium]|jgi:intracellular sulfur oxidation DsrE/DsrF family protein|nr:DsrE family protein [Xanthobacteraceae bacterium]